MECGSKKVEARPNYPCLRDLVPGTQVEFSNRFSGRSFLATITSRRVHRDFATMLRAESIKDCLPDRDPYDLQRAVNVYHSFRNETYKYIVKKHGVVSLRFEHVEPIQPKRAPRNAPETPHWLLVGQVKPSTGNGTVFETSEPRLLSPDVETATSLSEVRYSFDTFLSVSAPRSPV